MLGLVPLARAGRVVAHGHRDPETIGQGLQMDFQGAEPCTVAGVGIRADQQSPGLPVGFPSEQVPPPSNAFHGEFRRRVGDAHVDDRFVSHHVVGAVGDRLADALR